MKRLPKQKGKRAKPKRPRPWKKESPENKLRRPAPENKAFFPYHEEML